MSKSLSITKVGDAGITTYDDEFPELKDAITIKTPCVKNVMASNGYLTIYNSCSECKILTIAWLKPDGPVFEEYKVESYSQLKIKMKTGNSKHVGERSC